MWHRAGLNLGRAPFTESLCTTVSPRQEDYIDTVLGRDCGRRVPTGGGRPFAIKFSGRFVLNVADTVVVSPS